jgi:hypothetical protein
MSFSVTSHFLLLRPSKCDPEGIQGRLTPRRNGPSTPALRDKLNAKAPAPATSSDKGPPSLDRSDLRPPAGQSLLLSPPCCRIRPGQLQTRSVLGATPLPCGRRSLRGPFLREERGCTDRQRGPGRQPHRLLIAKRFRGQQGTACRRVSRPGDILASSPSSNVRIHPLPQRRSGCQLPA